MGLSGGSTVSAHSLPGPGGRAAQMGTPDVDDVPAPVDDVLAPGADEAPRPDEAVAEEPPTDDVAAVDVDEPGVADVEEAAPLEATVTPDADDVAAAEDPCAEEGGRLVDEEVGLEEEAAVAEEPCARDVADEVADDVADELAGRLLEAAADEGTREEEDASADDAWTVDVAAGRLDDATIETAAPLLEAVVTGSPPAWQYPSPHTEPRGQSPSELHGWTQESPWRSCPSAHLTHPPKGNIPAAATSARTTRPACLFMG